MTGYMCSFCFNSENQQKFPNISSILFKSGIEQTSQLVPMFINESYVNSNVIKNDMRQAGGKLSSAASLLGRSSL